MFCVQAHGMCFELKITVNTDHKCIMFGAQNTENTD